TTFTTVAPVVSGALVDIKTLPPITYENLDTVIQGRIDQIDAIKGEAAAAAKTAADALAAARDRADAALAAAKDAVADALAAAEQMATDARASALIDVDRVRRALAFDPSIRQANVDPIIADFRADVDILTQSVARNLREVAALRDALSTAGLEVIPQEGRVRFYAIEALQSSVGKTISNFSVTIDALSKKIDLYGSVQNSDLSGLINSISTVRTTLDALQGTITNLATAAQVNTVSARLSTAETTLDAQAAEISLRATQASVDDHGTRLTNAEQRISASEGRISQTVQASTGGAVDLALLPQTLAGFMDLIQRQQGAFQQVLGVATQNLTANIEAGERVTAELRTDLLAVQGDATAQFTSVARAIADTNSSIVSLQTLMEARFVAAQASISAEATARADADAAQTTQYAAAVSRIGASEAALVSEAKTRADADAAQTSQITAAVSRIGASEAALVSEAKTRASADEAQTSQIAAAVSRIGASEAALVSEAKTRASADEAQTSQIAAAVSRIGASEAALVSEAKTRASADEAQTSQITAAISRLGAAEAAIASEASTRATADTAQAQRVDGLTAAVGANATNITNLNVAIANDRGVNAASIRDLTARVGDVEGGVANALSSITAVETIRAQTDAAISSRIDTLVSRVGNAETSIAQEALTRASLDEAIGKYVAAIDTKIDGVNAGVTLETQSRVAGDAANAAQITDLYARSDAGTAVGRFAMTAVSAPGGVSVRLAMQASTESYGQRRNARLFLDLLPDGNSRLVVDANTFAITANGGTSYPFLFDGQTLTIPSLRVTNSAIIPGAVSQSDWAYSNDYIVEFQINCRQNSRVSIIAMFDGRPAQGVTLGQTGNLQILRGGNLLRTTPVSFYVAGNNENRLAFTLNTTTFVRDAPGPGLHTYRIQCTAFQGPVSALWAELGA
ncbi:hypothetical protein, partial [Methylobacterium tarhaniae]|uniref:hypothetical protein n=1 Tax=Methylobacterium tarhaniae TaxID=1187852 RepID=UPI003D03E6FE